ncbi:MAG TPA: transglycosylase SLT domain-containing protein [Steroidobacteraceae bacterium]|nr:transglycosylase SLT domain-containing protein [Steroidobacteraceae bacterium]
MSQPIRPIVIAVLCVSFGPVSHVEGAAADAAAADAAAGEHAPSVLAPIVSTANDHVPGDPAPSASAANDQTSGEPGKDAPAAADHARSGPAPSAPAAGDRAPGTFVPSAPAANDQTPGDTAASAPAADARSDPFVHPPALERDIRFWIRVYTEVTTDQGLLLDDWNLGLVYEVLRFDPASSPAQRERRVHEAKARYAALLRRFADGATEDLSAHERRILHAFGNKATPSDFRDAIERIRFQLGQADRFREGLIRSAVWEKQIARTLSQHGVPPEIAALPHVESSFNLAAYSKVGAAGLWQFMPTTARRFMRVDSIVDERLDPYSATAAAANLMLYNYRLVGTWPLAVTAYNHGPAGLRRAQEELGTSDIAVIIKRYQGSTFGFASRNFYVAFLAALEVDRNAEKYFGPITRLPDTESTPVELPDYISVDALAKAFKVDMGALRVLNPALRPPIWNGSRLVPRGYKVRLPGTPPESEIAAGWARLPPNLRYLAQKNDGSHRLRRGETLAGVAAASGVSLARLLAANGWTGMHAVARGDVVRIPMPASRAEMAGGAPALAAAAPSPAEISAAAALPAPVADAVPPPAASAPSKAEVQAARPPSEPVSARQTSNRDSLLPAASPSGHSDATNYEVLADDFVIVQAAETLGHFADWTRVDSQSLRRLNKLHKNAAVTQGARLKLDFSHVGAAQFVLARREYHRGLQEAFFAGHRIAATENYTVKRGDSLWNIVQQHADVPLWLVAQYNPDLKFTDIRPGTILTLPQVVGINRQ